MNVFLLNGRIIQYVSTALPSRQLMKFPHKTHIKFSRRKKPSVNYHQTTWKCFLTRWFSVMNSVSYRIKVIRLTCHQFSSETLSKLAWEIVVDCHWVSPFSFLFILIQGVSLWLALKNTWSENVSDFFFRSLYINFYTFRSIDVEFKLKCLYKW